MDLLENVLLRLRSAFGARSLDRELTDELSFHLEMQTAEYVRAGHAQAEARRLALRDFGGVDRMAEECRDERAGASLHQVLRAVRLATRRMRREPSFAVPAMATIALGFGALTSIFTLTDAVLLRPLEYADADRIVVLRHSLPGWGIAASGQSPGTIVHYREGSRVFESVGAWFERELSITESEAPERIMAALVSPGVLQVLGVQPLLGRGFNDEDRGGRAVMLSHEMWQRRYGGDPAVIGRTVRINSVEREIIGVLPAGADFPHASTQMLFGMGPVGEATRGDLRDLYMESIARLRPGMTVADAEADLVRLVGTLPGRYADVTAAQLTESQLTPRVVPLKESIVGDVRPALVLLLCTAVFVLLIALANVTNLVLVRAEHQRREIAVERALGAGYGAVVLRFAAEYALLVLAGAGLGAGLAWLAVHMRFGFDAWQIPRVHDIAVAGRSLTVAGLVAAAAAAALTLVAIVRTMRVDVQSTLKGSLQRVTAARETQLAQRALTAAQIALACALLVGSAVMVQSVIRLGRVPLGFNPQHTLVFDVALPIRQYPDYSAQAGFNDRLEALLRAIPGVQGVGAVSTLPLTPMPNWADVPVTTPGLLHEVPPMASMRPVTPGYFATLGIPLLRGRTFEPADLSDAGSGVILSAAVAHTLFGTLDVVGRTIVLPADESGSLTVVGVAGDVRDATLTAPHAPLIYLPSLGAARLTGGRAPIPFWPSEMTFVVRSSLPPETLLPAVRAALRELDAALPVAYPRTLDAMVAGSTARARMTTWLLLAGAASALLLGMVGSYGVVSYTVSRTRPELALRIALGASPGHVTWSVLRQVAGTTLIGVAVGVPIALTLTRLLASLLYEVSPHDARAFVLVPLALLLVALLASGPAAARAARTNPARALTD